VYCLASLIDWYVVVQLKIRKECRQGRLLDEGYAEAITVRQLDVQRLLASHPIL
jgi:hypothetical protein